MRAVAVFPSDKSIAVMQLFISRDTTKNSARALGMMRNGFGGHPYGPNAAIVDERQHRQVFGTFHGGK